MQQHPQQGYGPPPGYMQQGPPPKQGMPVWAKVLIALGLISLCGIGGCLVCAGIGAKAVSDAATSVQKQQENQKQEVQKAKTAPASEVKISKLLDDYKGNEVRADGTYKDKSWRVAGTVDDVKKGLGGGMYITIGTGKQFEIPQVQCHLDPSQTAKASALNKGAKVTVVGKVNGLLLHVQMDPCEIL